MRIARGFGSGSILASAAAPSRRYSDQAKSTASPPALEAEWQGFDIAETVPLDEITRAHELVEHPAKPGRVIFILLRTKGGLGGFNAVSATQIHNQVCRRHAKSREVLSRCARSEVGSLSRRVGSIKRG